MIHIFPVNDLKPHDTESTMCECVPAVEWEDPKTGKPYAEALVIHHAWDCREAVEEAEALLQNAEP